MNSLYESVRLSLRGMTIVMVALLAAIFPATTAAEAKGSSQLNLAAALRLTLENNIELARYPFARRREEALRIQAGIRPVPNAQFMVENALGSGEFAGIDATENTLMLTQLVELGDKRQRRVALGDARLEALQWEYELARLDVLAETTRRFFAVLELQEREKLLVRQLDATRDALQALRVRLDAGGAARADASRMSLLLAQLEADQAWLIDKQEIARMRLASMWQAHPAFQVVSGDVWGQPHFNDLAGVAEQISRAPLLAAKLAEQRMFEAELALQRANGRSDVALGVGLRQLNLVNDFALVFSIDSPLTFKDPNRGRIAAARQDLSLAAESAKWARQQLSLAVSLSVQQIEQEERRVKRILEVLLPAARQVEQDVLAGYARGIYSALEWTEAQRKVLILGEQALAQQMSMHARYLELNRLIGIGFGDADGESNQ